MTAGIISVIFMISLVAGPALVNGLPVEDVLIVQITSDSAAYQAKIALIKELNLEDASYRVIEPTTRSEFFASLYQYRKVTTVIGHGSQEGLISRIGILPWSDVESYLNPQTQYGFLACYSQLPYDNVWGFAQEVDARAAGICIGITALSYINLLRDNPTSEIQDKFKQASAYQMEMRYSLKSTGVPHLMIKAYTEKSFAQTEWFADAGAYVAVGALPGGAYYGKVESTDFGVPFGLCFQNIFTGLNGDGAPKLTIQYWVMRTDEHRRMARSGLAAFRRNVGTGEIVDRIPGTPNPVPQPWASEELDETFTPDFFTSLWLTFQAILQGAADIFVTFANIILESLHNGVQAIATTFNLDPQFLMTVAIIIAMVVLYAMSIPDPSSLTGVGAMNDVLGAIGGTGMYCATYNYFVTGASLVILGTVYTMGNTPDHATSYDDDGDGIYNEDEKFIGTDIADADSDNDGLTDGYEESINSNPLNYDTDDDGLVDGVDYSPTSFSSRQWADTNIIGNQLYVIAQAYHLNVDCGVASVTINIGGDTCTFNENNLIYSNRHHYKTNTYRFPRVISYTVTWYWTGGGSASRSGSELVPGSGGMY